MVRSHPYTVVQPQDNTYGMRLRCLHPRRRGALQISSGSTYATFDRTPIIVLSF
jgi:hypothetical protein